MSLRDHIFWDVMLWDRVCGSSLSKSTCSYEKLHTTHRMTQHLILGDINLQNFLLFTITILTRTLTSLWIPYWYWFKQHNTLRLCVKIQTQTQYRPLSCKWSSLSTARTNFSWLLNAIILFLKESKVFLTKHNFVAPVLVPHICNILTFCYQNKQTNKQHTFTCTHTPNKQTTYIHTHTHTHTFQVQSLSHWKSTYYRQTAKLHLCFYCCQYYITGFPDEDLKDQNMSEDEWSTCNSTACILHWFSVTIHNSVFTKF